MNSQLWLRGPEWLSSDTCPPSEQMFEVDLAELATDELKPHEIIFQINRWDSLGKAIRTVGWALRFTSNCSKKRKECATAAKQLLKITLKARKSVTKALSLYKLSPSIGEDGLLRVRRRLNYGNLSYDEKFPVIIPKSYRFLLFTPDSACIEFTRFLCEALAVNMNNLSLTICQCFHDTKLK
ncbi:retrovirus-related pol polyprotein from transposon 17.6 [Plakobranchus ocellatus]|uniref:Retrovirus-related pol polyprotein from transposon 17.6 n=1 Tax=Plakobranchus ocellatus TaxID=259542 RepID=A0AAV4D9Q3_9GAST|nr:retrovirus-related pol polyprotein from transposon 17.6 [Plakobranchus ocellatus]